MLNLKAICTLSAAKGGIQNRLRTDCFDVNIIYKKEAIKIRQLFDLISADAPPGCESALGEHILSEIKPYCEAKIDRAGNIIAFKRGKKASDLKIMFCAHMDEVGVIVTEITREGFLRFDTLGGIDKRVLFGKRVKVGKTQGVIGACPVHLLEENEKLLPEKELYIDIGAKSEEDAALSVAAGNCGVFYTDSAVLGSGLIKAKALDDRAGCLILMELLRAELEYDIFCVFTVKEEAGCFGAQAASFSLNPDICIVLEATTAADIDGNTDEKAVCRLGKGVVITHTDKGAFYDRELYELAVKTAEENNIRWQTKTQVAGGNDASRVKAQGAQVLALSVPCRYIHCPAGLMDPDDWQAARRLAEILIGKLG